jgi:anti-anti-sigma factor
MTRRSRHGMHVVRDVDARGAGKISPASPIVPAPLFLNLHQQSVMLAVAGKLNAETAGRLRMYLSMFTVDGGPEELVLDLSDVFAVDADGMAPIVEAEEEMCLRTASVRLVSLSAAVTRYLDDVRRDRTLAACRPPAPDGGPGEPDGGSAEAALDDGPRRGQD